MSENSKSAAKPKSELRETIVVIIEALVIALVFRTFFYQPFSIPTASMQSTLMIGDYLLANKFVWGYGQYSFPLGIVPLNGARLLGREPNRGDIAVFRPVPQRDPYIKRIVGMPGERIQMIDGILHINGTAVKREQVGITFDKDSTGFEVPVTVYRETFPEGTSHTIQEISDNSPLDNTQEFVVPSGHYFMMGDNRDRSADSRVRSVVGYVPAGNLIGKAEVRFFSIADNIPPWQLWQWPANVRWDRMLESVYQ